MHQISVLGVNNYNLQNSPGAGNMPCRDPQSFYPSFESYMQTLTIFRQPSTSKQFESPIFILMR